MVLSFSLFFLFFFFPLSPHSSAVCADGFIAPKREEGGGGGGSRVARLEHAITILVVSEGAYLKKKFFTVGLYI